MSKKDNYIYLNLNEFDFEHHPDVLISLNSQLLSKYYNINYDADLKELISTYIQIDPKYIFLMNGGDSCIEYIYKQINSIEINTPTYDNYFLFAEWNNVKKGNQAIMICNPNNPTGTLHTIDYIKKMLQQDKIVIVDETYMDYLTLLSQYQHSAISLVPQYNNLYVIRSFSKAFGLAGLRLAYIVSKNIESIENIYNKKNVTDISKICAMKILKNVDYYRDKVIEMNINKERLVHALVKKGYAVINTVCNFICVKNMNAKCKHFVFRDIHNRMPNYIRITIGNTLHTDKIIDYVNSLS